MDLKDYYHKKYANDIQALGDDVSQALVNGEDIVTVVNVWGSIDWESDKALLEPVGISEDEARSGGTWICNGGKVEKVINRGEDSSYTLSLEDGDYLRINETSASTEILINEKDYYDKKSRIQIIGYDKFLNKEIFECGYDKLL